MDIKGRLAAIGVTGGLLCMGAAITAEAAPVSAGLAPRSPEIMLYFSHSIGGGASAGGMRPTFGLRVQQVRQGGNNGDPEAGDSMQHRELINWQMEAHSNLHVSDVRVKVGDRLTYDVTHRQFGAPSSRSAMQIGVPTLRNSSLDASVAKTLSARALSPMPAGHEPANSSGRGNSNIREIAAAAVAALAPTRFTSAQRQNAQHQGGIAGVVAAQRMQGVRNGFANAN